MPRQTQAIVLQKFLEVFHAPFVLEVTKFRASKDKDNVLVLPPLTLNEIAHYNDHIKTKKNWHVELVQLSMSTLHLEVEKLLYRCAPLAQVDDDHPLNRHVLNGLPS